MSSDTLLQLLEVKARRDVVREALIRELQRAPAGLPVDVVALLRVDADSSEEFARALANHAAQQETSICR